MDGLAICWTTAPIIWDCPSHFLMYSCWKSEATHQICGYCLPHWFYQDLLSGATEHLLTLAPYQTPDLCWDPLKGFSSAMPNCHRLSQIFLTQSLRANASALLYFFLHIIIAVSTEEDGRFSNVYHLAGPFLICSEDVCKTLPSTLTSLSAHKAVIHK